MLAILVYKYIYLNLCLSIVINLCSSFQDVIAKLRRLLILILQSYIECKLSFCLKNK